jgi:hypothetical protein
MAAETFAAVALAILVGVLVTWLSYVALPASERNSLPLAAFGISILTFAAFPLFRWPRQGAPMGGIVLFTVIGFVPTIIGSAVLIIMLCCRYGDCINL